MNLLLPAILPLCALALCIGFSAYFRDNLRQQAPYYYVGSVILVLGIAWLSFTDIPRLLASNPWAIFPYNLFKRGAIGTALIIIVMYIGAVSEQSWFYKTFRPIRAQLAILGAQFTFLHNIIYGKKYFIALFMDPGSLKPVQLIATYLSLAALLILIPLWITSFRSIQKRMSFPTWRKLQRLSYVFFTLIMLHILVLYAPAVLSTANKINPKALVGFSYYALVLLVYAYLRIRKAQRKSA